MSLRLVQRSTRAFGLSTCLLGLTVAHCTARPPDTPQGLSTHEAQQALAISFVDNFKQARPIKAIPPGSITEADAYAIADLYVAALMPHYGEVAGYKVGTFVAGEYDHGPVNGLSGPVTAVMLSKGMLKSGGHVSADCCNMTFVEADFAAEVGSEAINDAKADLDLLAALRGMRPFIEMPDLLQPAPGSSNVGGIATNYDFRHGIVGDLIPVEATGAGIDRLNSFRYQMTNEDGDVLGEGQIKDAYEPLKRVRALRDRLQLRGRRLKAGDILSLGNMGTIRPLKPNLHMKDRPLFKGSIGTVTYFDLDPNGPASVSVHIDRPQGP